MRGIPLVSALAFLIAVGPMGCAGDGTDPDNPSDEGSITIAPGPLTLNVGGTGTLSATVRDAAGAIVPSTVAWATRNPLVAAITSSGTVTGIAVGQTMAVASAGARRDSVLVIVLDDLTLEVVPGTGAVQVGRTFQFSAVARNGAGQVIATPPLTWAAGSQAIATINASGTATGVARGATSITASARGVTSPPAQLVVTDAAAASCDGIGSVAEWNGSVDYTFGIRGTSEGGFEINSDNKGNVKATLVAQVPQVEPLLVWKGKLSGTASLHETKGNGSDVTKLDGEGPVLTVAGGYEPTLSLIVDTRTCTYKVAAVTTLSLRQTEPDGRTTTSETLVAMVQVGQTAALGAWRTLGISDLADTPYPGHSVAWLALNPDKSGFAPLGFAAELVKEPSITGPGVGAATVSYVLTRK